MRFLCLSFISSMMLDDFIYVSLFTVHQILGTENDTSFSENDTLFLHFKQMHIWWIYWIFNFSTLVSFISIIFYFLCFFHLLLCFNPSRYLFFSSFKIILYTLFCSCDMIRARESPGIKSGYTTVIWYANNRTHLLMCACANALRAWHYQTGNVQDGTHDLRRLDRARVWFAKSVLTPILLTIREAMPAYLYCIHPVSPFCLTIKPLFPRYWLCDSE